MKYRKETKQSKSPTDQPRRELLVDLFFVAVLPLSTLVAVLFGTQEGSTPNHYIVTNWLALPFLVLLVRAVLGWYSRGRSRQGRWQSAKLMMWAVALAGICIVLSLPGLPLSGRWHAHDPTINVSILVMIEFPISLAVLWNLGRNLREANRNPELRGERLWKKFF